MQCFHDYRFCPKISEEWAIDLNLSAPPPTKIWLRRLCFQQGKNNKVKNNKI